MNWVKRVLLFALVVAGLSGAAGAAHAAPDDVTADNFEVMLVVDTSGSIKEAMPQVQQAAVGFVNLLPTNVRVGLVAFGKTISVSAQPTADRVPLTDAINGLAAGGETPLYDAVLIAANSFTPAAQHKAMVVLSDGKDTQSAHTLEEAIAAVQGEHVEAISLTTSETDLAALQALGTVTPADDPAALSVAFSRVAGLLTEVVLAPTTVPAPTPAAPATAPVTEPTTAPAPVPTTAPVTELTTVPATVYRRPPAPVSALTSTESSFPWLPALAVFAGLFALTLLFWPRRKISRARLGIQSPRSVADMGRRTSTAVEEFLERQGKRGDLSTALSVADIGIKPGEFVALVALIALVAGLVGLFFGGPLVALIAAVVVCFGTRVVLTRKKDKRQEAFAEQLPDVLQLLTTSLRSGYSLTQALDSVAEEAEEPARSEFAHVLVETRLGRDLSASMRAMAERMDNADLEWVVGAIDINRDTGGNLSEILGQVSTTIRERARMKRQVRTLTAEGRMSARILTALPLVMAFWQWRANPDNFALLTEGMGLVLLVVAGILMTLGWFWVRKIVNSVAL